MLVDESYFRNIQKVKLIFALVEKSNVLAISYQSYLLP